MWLSLVLVILTIYYLLFRNELPKLDNLYSQQGGFRILWNQTFLKVAFTYFAVIRRFRRKRNVQNESAQFRFTSPCKPLTANDLSFTACDKTGNVMHVRLCRHHGDFAEVSLSVRLADGRTLSHVSDSKSSVPITMDETPSGDEADDDYIAAGGVRICAVDPVKTYRILYTGPMRLHDNDGADEFVPVDIRMWFKLLADPVDFAVDFCPGLVASCVAVEPCPISSAVRFLCPATVRNKQCGELRGLIQVGDSQPIEVSLNGQRDYSTGKALAADNSGFFALQARLEKGLVFSLHVDCFPENKMTHLVSGFVTFQNGYVYPVSWTDLHLANLQSTNIPTKMTVNLEAHGRIFSLSLEVVSKRTKTHYDPSNEYKPLLVHENVVKVTLEDSKEIGYGIVEFNRRGQRVPLTKGTGRDELRVLTRQLPEPTLPLTHPHCVQLSDPLCRVSNLTGGKAARLADIIACVYELSDVDFHVPNGFTITSAAFEEHLRQAPELAKLRDKVLSAADSLTQSYKDEEQVAPLTAKLQEACDELHEKFLSTPITDSLEREIERQLKATFGEKDWKSVFTAVRSSAVGEDSTEASGAGQMETYLGRRGIERILEAVRLCWASHYAFRAIQYRRQLCARLDSPMAVVVQRLVKADVAGVMFTRHPDNGSMATTMINACYGIGEGVVSGHVQPDSIRVIQANPTDKSQVEIVYDNIGEKLTAFMLDEELGDIEEQFVIACSDSPDKQCCLSEEDIRRLWRIGKLLERCFGSSRDVEFAVQKSSTSGRSAISILQARPIITSDMENDWEMTHEFDTPIVSDHEWITTANIQEMMPGALSPLSGQMWFNQLSKCIENPQVGLYLKPSRRYGVGRCCSTYFQHMFLNWTLIGVNLYDDFEKSALEMSMFGQRHDCMATEHFSEQNDMGSSLWRKAISVRGWIGRIMPRHALEKLEQRITNYPKPTTAKDSKAVLEHINNELSPLSVKVWTEHLKITLHSSMYAAIMMLTLDSSLNWGAQMYEDMSMLLSSCKNVISADVPAFLEKIVDSIKSDEQAVSFVKSADIGQIALWLMSSPESGCHGQLFREFLAKHGHRCVREADIRELSWSQRPEVVVDSLKIMVASEKTSKVPSQHKKEISAEEALAAIKTPVDSWIKRKVLQIVLPKARLYVAKREWSKSLSIKMMDNMRQHVYRLAQLLVEQGQLPDDDLVFFLSLRELKILVDKKHSPQIVAKALRRRKIFSKFEGLQFPELFTNHVTPVSSTSVLSTPLAAEGAFELNGIAVGNGSVEGVARVVSSLAEANEIKTGDILVVPYTDVGWTPYFPMISGLITELGGMMSHGAVIAREYGLPCMVGCKNATQLIKTGNGVYIDGHLGQVKIFDQK